MEESEIYIKRLAVDLAKNVFQLYGIDSSGQEVLKKRISGREKFAEFVAKLSPCEIVMEACGNVNYWARKFMAYGSLEIIKQYVEQ